LCLLRAFVLKSFTTKTRRRHKEHKGSLPPSRSALNLA
jgi:hypothetical protein